MNSLIIITMLSYTLAHYVPSPGSPNVGTVLFQPSDLDKTDWSRTNIALLQARKYMQNILPSPHLGSINEEYITNLLNYFDKSYKIVKREIKNPYLCNMMDVALSDALGGYLKIWVLPIAKYSYYGGVLSLENCRKVFDTYEDIKRNLKTDGRGWRNPNKYLLNSVEISIVPPLYSSIGSMGSPCKQLAYYEKTDEGMKIPIPYINWDISPPTMFLPLLNQSIVSLSSPSSSSALLKYYALADECTKSEIQNLDDFYNRFGKWLSDEVAPHLNDDKFYAAFGNILSLMHSTKQFCGKQISSFKEHFLRDPVTFTSKRFLIIALILIVELLWCLASVVYTVRLVRKKRIEKHGYKPCSYRPHKRIKILYKDNPHTKFTNFIPKQSSRGLKLLVEPKPVNLEIGAQSCYNSENMKSINLFSENVFSCRDLMNLENEMPLKVSSVTNVPAFDTARTLVESRNTHSEIDPRKIKIVRKHNVKKTQELKMSRTFTLVQSPVKYIKDVTYKQENIKLSQESTLDDKNNITQNTQQKCSDASCNKFRDPINKSKAKLRNLKITEKNKKPSSKIVFSQIDPIIEKQKGTMMETNEILVKKKNDCKLRSPYKPILSILIERPQTSIELGITSCKGPGTTERPSKIPRAVRLSKGPIITKTTETLTKINNLKIKNENTQERKRSIRRKTLDAITIKQTSINKNDKKLNETF